VVFTIIKEINCIFDDRDFIWSLQVDDKYFIVVRGIVCLPRKMVNVRFCMTTFHFMSRVNTGWR